MLRPGAAATQKLGQAMLPAGVRRPGAELLLHGPATRGASGTYGGVGQEEGARRAVAGSA